MLIPDQNAERHLLEAFINKLVFIDHTASRSSGVNSTLSRIFHSQRAAPYYSSLRANRATQIHLSSLIRNELAKGVRNREVVGRSPVACKWVADRGRRAPAEAAGRHMHGYSLFSACIDPLQAEDIDSLFILSAELAFPCYR